MDVRKELGGLENGFSEERVLRRLLLPFLRKRSHVDELAHAVVFVEFRFWYVDGSCGGIYSCGQISFIGLNQF